MGGPEFDHGELRISKQAVVTKPKTKAAVRTLLLPPKVLEVFREYRNRNPSRWLFPSPKKEDSPLLPSVVRQRLHRLLDHAGIAKAQPLPAEENALQERTMTDFHARKRWSRRTA